CRKCHNERERKARKRRLERQRARRGELEKTVELLTITWNSNTKEKFESQCRSRYVIVTADPGEEAQGFAGIVAGFHPGDMISVLDARGYSHAVPLRRIKPDR